MLQERARKIAIQEQIVDDMSKNYEHQMRVAVDAHGKKLKEQRLKENQQYLLK